MRIKVTANYPPEAVRQLIRFAASQVDGLKRDGLTIWVKNSSHPYRGFAYPNGHTTIGIGKPQWFPILGDKRRGLILSDWRETVVMLAAHELAHQRSHQDGKHKGESPANWYGWFAVMQYRQSLRQ